MRKTVIIILLTSVIIPTVLINAQPMNEPPMDNDEFGWMRWVILTLVGALATAFGVIKKIYDDRIKDKDREIEELKRLIESLNNDKDDLQKDIMEKVIPAVVSATDLIRSFMNK